VFVETLKSIENEFEYELKAACGVTGKMLVQVGNHRGMSLAEYAAVDATMVVVFPTGVNFLATGDRVLINGAAGGVGSFAIQLAQVLGASKITAAIDPIASDNGPGKIVVVPRTHSQPSGDASSVSWRHIQ
jgi:hypothetical protein